MKLRGKVWHVVWDIPTYYAIDSNNECWMSNAHGNVLSPVSPAKMLSSIKDETDLNVVRKILGMKPIMPYWARMALDNGWTPPKGWGQDHE